MGLVAPGYVKHLLSMHLCQVGQRQLGHNYWLQDILVITRDQELGLFYVDTEPFTFYAILPRLEFGDKLLLGARDEEPPWYISAELTRQRLQHQNEEQWAEDRILMHTNFHAKLLTALTIEPHTIPGLVHALDDPHNPFLDPKAP